MKILGVDPGSQRTGWGLIASGRPDCTLIECGVIGLPKSLPFPVRLLRLRDRLTEVVLRAAPDAVAVETPFHGANARSALQLAHARGVILCVLAASELPIAEYTPATVKKAVTGNGRADKGQMQRMVRVLLGSSRAMESEDLADALAVALCHAQTSRFADALARVRQV